MRVRRIVSQQKIKLLPLSEEEQAALLMAITLVLTAINTADNKDPLIKVVLKTQIKPLQNIKQKLET